MIKRSRAYVPALATFVLTLAPIILSAVFAYYLAASEVYQKSAVVADIVSDRVVRTSEQLSSAFQELDGVDPSAACDKAAITLMAHNDLRSSLIQSFGYIQDNKLLCTSYGLATPPLDVGAPDYISSKGMRMRRARSLSMSLDVQFLLVSDPRGFTAVIHPKLTLILASPSSNYSFGVSSLSSNTALLKQGTFSLAHETAAALLKGGESGTRVISGHMVVWRHPAGLDLVVYAAAPLSETWWSFAKALLWLFPLGMVISGVTNFLLRKLTAHQASLATMLKRGLRQGELFLVYQPIVDIRSGAWVGAESLLRWKRPDGELVSPDIFIPIAEKNGLMDELTKFVITLGLQEFSPLMTDD